MDSKASEIVDKITRAIGESKVWDEWWEERRRRTEETIRQLERAQVMTPGVLDMRVTI